MESADFFSILTHCGILFKEKPGAEAGCCGTGSGSGSAVVEPVGEGRGLGRPKAATEMPGWLLLHFRLAMLNTAAAGAKFRQVTLKRERESEKARENE